MDACIILLLSLSHRQSHLIIIDIIIILLLFFICPPFSLHRYSSPFPLVSLPRFPSCKTSNRYHSCWRLKPLPTTNIQRNTTHSPNPTLRPWPMIIAVTTSQPTQSHSTSTPHPLPATLSSPSTDFYLYIDALPRFPPTLFLLSLYPV